MLPMVVEVVTFLGYFLLVPSLAGLYASHSAWNHVVLLPGFFLILVGVITVRMLPAYSVGTEEGEEEGPGVIAVCLAVIMIVIYGMLYTGATNIGGSGKGNDGVTGMIFFIFLVPYLASFNWPVERALPGSKKAIFVEAISLALINYFTLLGAAVWHCFSNMKLNAGAVQPTGITHLVLWFILIGIFMVAFGLPRIYLLLSTNNHRGFLVYLFGVGYFLWSRVPSL